MIIKRLSAAFGKLQNESLVLEPGLNIIQAPNEYGKSTWCAFIKAMLYGIRTADRDKTGYLSDKTRFRPWSGAPMAGSMDLETNGVTVTLERRSDGKYPLIHFNALYTGTRQAYTSLTSDTAGETLLGVTEAVFERSAYISQAGLRVIQSPELEKRISALVTTGDESASYTQTDDRLRAWHRKRRFNKSGTLPALEEKIAGYCKTLTHIEAAVDEASAMRLEAERLQKQCSELQLALDRINQYEALQTYRRAEEKLSMAQAACRAIQAELTKNGPAPDARILASIRSDLKTLESLKTIADGEQKKLEAARVASDIIVGKQKAAEYSGEEPLRIFETAVSLNTQTRNQSFGSLPAILIWILTLLSVVTTAVTALTEPGIPALLPAAATVTVIGAVLLFWRGIRLSRCKKELQRLLSRYNVTTVSALKALSDNYTALAESAHEADSDVRAFEKSLSAAYTMYDTAYQSLLRKLSALSIPPESDTVGQELDRFETLLQKLADAKSESLAAESYMNAVLESGSCTPDTAGMDIPPPDRSKSELTAELNLASIRFEDLSRRHNMVIGEIRALGDPVVLGSDKAAAEATLLEHRTQFDALSLAIDTLKEANLELQSRFSPLLGTTAGRILERLTSGRYEKLTFDKSLDAFAKSTDETVSRHILTLSAGTADQIYLALRLAVCELVSAQGEPGPLILDDALTNFDDNRAQIALDYLKELSATRQILLFTCHGREAAYLSSRSGDGKSPEVHIVRLS